MDLISTFAKRLAPGLIALILRLDKDAFASLKPHHNKIVCLHVQPLAPLFFQIQQDKIQSINEDSPADVTFSGPMSAFMSMILNKDHVQSGLHIRGDMECAKALYDAWYHLDIDLEGFLAPFLGDTVAHAICQSLQKSRSFVKEVTAARMDDLGAFLQDEAKLLPTKTEVEHYFSELDKLKHDVDRLDAKIRILVKRSGDQGS
jgi:ubiquinone biosynthesis protein UbiJ